jgi:hypothetical protein
MTGAPMLKAAGLWEKTSAAGNSYLTGRLGGVKVLILENRDRGGDSEPSHHLFFVDGSKPAEARNAAPARSGYSARRPAAPQRGGSLPNDPVTDLWPEEKP